MMNKMGKQLEPNSRKEYRSFDSLMQTMMDTLSIARNLSEAGVDWKQAQAHAAVIAHAVEQQHGDVATKEFVRSELNALRGELSSEISALRGELSSEISAVHGEISAVRGEISTLRGELSSEISTVESKISTVEARLLRWMVGIIFTAISIVIAAQILIP